MDPFIQSLDAFGKLCFDFLLCLRSKSENPIFITNTKMSATLLSISETDFTDRIQQLESLHLIKTHQNGNVRNQKESYGCLEEKRREEKRGEYINTEPAKTKGASQLTKDQIQTLFGELVNSYKSAGLAEPGENNKVDLVRVMRHGYEDIRRCVLAIPYLPERMKASMSLPHTWEKTSNRELMKNIYAQSFKPQAESLTEEMRRLRAAEDPQGDL